MPQYKRGPKGNYAFIDSQNLNLGIQKMGWKLNWQKFHDYLRDQFNVQKAFMFIGYMPDNVNLYEQMHDIGYFVVLKPTLEMYKNPAGTDEGQSKESDEKRLPVKGNTDAELVLYAVKELPNYQKAIIVSGDGDFYSLVEYLAQKNRLLHLMTPNYQYSSLLKPFDEYILRLDQHKKELRYFSRKNLNSNKNGGNQK
jgi:uncharacterized LabA/DUF88 family protein